MTILLTLLLSMVCTRAIAYDANVDGVYYNFVGTTAEVTYYSDIWRSGSGRDASKPFKNGEVMSLHIRAKSGIELKRYSLQLSQVMLSDADGLVKKIGNRQSTIKVRGLVPEPGDLNDDGEVDVTDVVELIDMVLSGIYDASLDINGDGEVDVTDVVELIDMVLAGE